jgi:hypothetical protein
MGESHPRDTSAYGDSVEVPAAPGWRGNRLGASIALHPVEFAHELGALVNGVPQHQAFADEACPKEGD